MVKIKIPKTKRPASPDQDPKEDQSPKRQRITLEPVDLLDESDQNSHSESQSDEDGDVEVVCVQLSPKPSNFRKTQCPVCLDTPDVLVSTECGHLYCYDCVFAALSSTSRAELNVGECSVCRKLVRYDKVTYLQLRKRPGEA